MTEQQLTLHPQINSKWIKDLSIRLDTMKYLEENIGKTLFVINHKIFFDPPPNENKNKQRDLIKLKSFCLTKKSISKT